MITVDEALALIGGKIAPGPAEKAPLSAAAGRVLARAATARITHPQQAVSAMDGYAVDLSSPLREGARLRVIGEAPAGKPFPGPVGDGAVRIFTGGVMPEGADHVIIQENTRREGDEIVLCAPQESPANVRPAGGDFIEGAELLPAGRRLSPIDVSLLAAGGLCEISVYRKPRVAIFVNGDELAAPGEAIGPGQVYESISAGLAPLLQAWGAEARFIGLAGDREEEVARCFYEAAGADIVVPVGGASVGDYDLVKKVARERFTLLFEKVAVKPGKPVWFGLKDEQFVLGFPGNPASAFVCAHLFLRPALRRMQGGEARLEMMRAVLRDPLGANGAREQFLRARVAPDGEGRLACSVSGKQDSSLLSTFAASNALLRRRAQEEAREAGALCEVLMLSDGL